jgi:hypothetical protein
MPCSAAILNPIESFKTLSIILIERLVKAILRKSRFSVEIQQVKGPNP